MIVWVQINTQPVYTFYAVEKVRDIVQLSGLTFCRLLSISSITRPCSLSGGSESANLSISLDNSDGYLTEFFKIPPHRVKTLVSGYYNERMFELFRGT
ncbi:MAG: hypothetical protein U9N61_07915, partial [Euryarchaeota archaeon]|nr:hypothetical protein [Euryarchaeota archaeon]